jgi:hypothetical protein
VSLDRVDLASLPGAPKHDEHGVLGAEVRREAADCTSSSRSARSKTVGTRSLRLLSLLAGIRPGGRDGVAASSLAK